METAVILLGTEIDESNKLVNNKLDGLAKTIFCHRCNENIIRERQNDSWSCRE